MRKLCSGCMVLPAAAARDVDAGNVVYCVRKRSNRRVRITHVMNLGNKMSSGEVLYGRSRDEWEEMRYAADSFQETVAEKLA